MPALALLWTWRLSTALAVLALAGCAGTSRTGRDGPGASPPPNLAAVPDAEPRIDPVRNGGPNKPYEVFGRGYTPMNGDRAIHRARSGVLVRPQVPRPADLER